MLTLKYRVDFSSFGFFSYWFMEFASVCNMLVVPFDLFPTVFYKTKKQKQLIHHTG